MYHIPHQLSGNCTKLFFNDYYIALLHRYAENLEILFFDWDGRAIAKCHVKEKLVDFAVDWTNLTIYGVDENDMVYQYEPISSL